MKKRKLIIDTDCGSDDAMAIAMALNDPGYEILMFSTVSGNVRMEQATANLLTTLKITDTYDPPVYQGSDEMRKRDWVGAYDTHGSDGMGDLSLIDPSLKPQEGNAVDMILKTLSENEAGQIDIITLGPLTNIAAAIEKSPEIMRRTNRIVSMATPGKASGNMTPYAEFNVWQDAEAFDYVLNSEVCEILLVGWSSCLNDAILDENDIVRIRESGTLGKFLIDANRTLIAMNLDRFKTECLDMADPAAIAAALYPECIRECGAYYCFVDTQDGDHYGEVRIDFEKESGRRPNASVCTELDGKKFKEYLYQRLQIKKDPA